MGAETPRHGAITLGAGIDHFGRFGAHIAPVTPTRAIGIAVIAIGVLLT